MVVIAAIVVGLVASGYALHRLLKWAERRGYVYYLEKSRPPTPSLGLLEQIYKPEIEYVVDEEASEFVRAERDDRGRGRDDDPEA